ncbi:hypothetical protein KC131_24110 [Pseudomonas sp. JQ170]|jgi:hypothetical protein|uniref:hypothetical protein n=1 Tax=Pseudomonas TaxID=286 RepID=UPI000418E3FF|nr:MULTISPECIES: hypothetical protein [Pseudomonas]MCW2269769.1 hypothetical protein [Pseudomonas sp. JUb96]MDN7143739.1 hypothetical protein [Pseudomonas sp. JQ170]PRA58626.1 hypothetical protein CQ065_23185 [Pseudomonas sp. MYb187]WRO75366.1 hypothetical protein U9R80_23220 [Pseudomonas sp. 170C]
MSNSMGIASVFALSSLLLSPLAMAEESQAFVAQNAARAAVHDQARQAFAAEQGQSTKPAEQTASKVSSSDAADS